MPLQVESAREAQIPIFGGIGGDDLDR